ncbi:MAG: CoA-binding protein, partial [Thermodesulfobacteriota bacterium]|nr:CoA-binding protein [Thermodesulfobacteriota bacterium]
MAHLDHLFFTESIAVIGASSNRMKFGYKFFSALIEAGYKGRLYPINKNEDEILGHKTYPSILDVPERVDYAIFCIPAHYVAQATKECGEKGVRGIQLFTAGFKETESKEGIEREKLLVETAKKYGIRIIGPNCIGISCTESRISYGPMPIVGEPGPVSLFSQSGGHAGSLLRDGLQRGIKFNKIVSYGNGCDVNATELLEYFLGDSKTLIIGGYIEGLEDGRKFFEIAKKVSKIKPTIIWKGGMTDTGAKTAASHTGSISGSNLIWKNALKQTGIISVQGFEELADTLLGLSYLP